MPNPFGWPVSAFPLESLVSFDDPEEGVGPDLQQLVECDPPPTPDRVARDPEAGSQLAEGERILHRVEHFVEGFDEEAGTMTMGEERVDPPRPSSRAALAPPTPRV